MNTDEIRAKLADVFKKVLGASGPLRDEIKPGDLDGWDSVAHVTLIVAVEREFKVKFKAADIAKAVNVGGLIAQIQAKTAR